MFNATGIASLTAPEILSMIVTGFDVREVSSNPFVWLKLLSPTNPFSASVWLLSSGKWVQSALGVCSGSKWKLIPEGLPV